MFLYILHGWPYTYIKTENNILQKLYKMYRYIKAWDLTCKDCQSDSSAVLIWATCTCKYMSYIKYLQKIMSKKTGQCHWLWISEQRNYALTSYNKHKELSPNWNTYHNSLDI